MRAALQVYRRLQLLLLLSDSSTCFTELLRNNLQLLHGCCCRLLRLCNNFSAPLLDVTQPLLLRLLRLQQLQQEVDRQHTQQPALHHTSRKLPSFARICISWPAAASARAAA